VRTIPEDKVRRIIAGLMALAAVLPTVTARVDDTLHDHDAVLAL
jgi:hypothetical protein